MALIYALLAGLAVSAVSLIGLLTFFAGKDIHARVSHMLLALAAGAMLGNALLHLMPHAITLEQEWTRGAAQVHVHGGGATAHGAGHNHDVLPAKNAPVAKSAHEHNHDADEHDHGAAKHDDHDHGVAKHDDHDHGVAKHDDHEHDAANHDDHNPVATAPIPVHGHSHTGLWTAFLMLAGFVGFYAIDILLRSRIAKNGEKPEGYLAAFGDGIENFLDGIVIGTAFMLSIPAGIAATLTIFIHEIPLELGDFAVMRHAGFSKRKAVLTNLLSAALSLVGICTAFAIGSVVASFVFFGTAIAAGSLFYIAACILIPHVRKSSEDGGGFQYFLVSMFGLALMAAILLFE
ncbi:MAG: ZIP family metal transporter [Candidatus Melainabacteria bacterium]|nr:ZIP family metal transporter [Candidatus Melainabacteria bacterium]